MRLPLIFLTWRNPGIGAGCRQCEYPDRVRVPIVDMNIRGNKKNESKVVERSNTGKSVAKVGLDVDAVVAVAQGQAVAGEEVEQGDLDGTMDQQLVQGCPGQVVGFTLVTKMRI